MSVLPEACARLSASLPAAWRLTSHPDTDGTRTSRQPTSRPPWNAPAASAALDAHEGLRRLEASMRLAVTGWAGRRRGGSDSNTRRALEQIEALGDTMTTRGAAEAARILDRWAMAIDQLPAVDECERPQHVPGFPCPYCGFAMLRVYPKAGRVACVRYGACQDADGNTPTGLMGRSALDGSPCISWSDGLVT